jgi:hypothetical protein
MRCERKKRCDEPVLPWCHAYESKPKLAALKIDLMRKKKKEKNMKIEKVVSYYIYCRAKEMSLVVAGLLSIIFVVPWKRSIADEVRKIYAKTPLCPS